LIISERFSVEKQRIVDNRKARMPHFLQTTLTVTFVIFLISIWALEAKIAGKREKFSALDAADTEAGGFPLRIKRNLWQFGLMILCQTKRNPLDYNGYGCYCGLGGGGKSVDDIDKCCQVHDACYGQITHEELCTLDSDVYLKGYKREGCSGCASSNDACQMAICKCDSVAAKCFAKCKYNSEYKR